MVCWFSFYWKCTITIAFVPEALGPPTWGFLNIREDALSSTHAATSTAQLLPYLALQISYTFEKDRRNITDHISFSVCAVQCHLLVNLFVPRRQWWWIDFLKLLSNSRLSELEPGYLHFISLKGMAFIFILFLIYHILFRFNLVESCAYSFD